MNEFKLLDKLILSAGDHGFVLYDIMFRNAGVGLLFYNERTGGIPAKLNNSWKEHLSVTKYYPTFKEAIEGELKKFAGEEATNG